VANDLLARAMAALNDERADEAEQIASALLRADPQDAGALYVLGCALTLQGRAGEAIAPLEAATSRVDDPVVDTMLAIALCRLDRHEDAINRLVLTTQRHPRYAAAFKELGYLLVLVERYGEAVEVLTRGLEIAPLMPELSVQLGYAHLSRGDCTAAKVVFARALDFSPSPPEALFGIAKAHQEVGENEAAAVYFRRYLTLRPGDSGAWLNLGHCLLELGQADAGYECFRTAASGGPKQYGNALTSLAAATRGRFWLKPSQAARFLQKR
jgi:tetratricopeptide (TPR) repeat protein